MRKALSVFLATAFVLTSLGGPAAAQSALQLPLPGAMVSTTPAYFPTVLKGIQIYPDKPLAFNFLVDRGDDMLEGDAFKAESAKLIKYFLAALTIPEDQMWVNLSPNEPDRIIPDQFGQTEMGRDLLAQDYLLKQLSASLMYPEHEVGKKFWERVNANVRAEGDVSLQNIPANIMNKIWIVPAESKIYEHARGAFVVEARLKVMLEGEYVKEIRDKRSEVSMSGGEVLTDQFTSDILREVLLPAIEHEVNEGATFAPLRQIYHSMLLATWYKNKLKDSLLGKTYVDQAKTDGVNMTDPAINQKIYEQYLTAFKRGAYNMIKEEYDPITQNVIPRKYFSGGAVMKEMAAAMTPATRREIESAAMSVAKRIASVSTRVEAVASSAAMTAEKAKEAVRGYIQPAKISASSFTLNAQEKEGTIVVRLTLNGDSYSPIKAMINPEKFQTLSNAYSVQWKNVKNDSNAIDFVFEKREENSPDAAMAVRKNFAALTFAGVLGGLSAWQVFSVIERRSGEVMERLEGLEAAQRQYRLEQRENLLQLERSVDELKTMTSAQHVTELSEYLSFMEEDLLEAIKNQRPVNLDEVEEAIRQEVARRKGWMLPADYAKLLEQAESLMQDLRALRGGDAAMTAVEENRRESFNFSSLFKQREKLRMLRNEKWRELWELSLVPNQDSIKDIIFPHTMFILQQKIDHYMDVMRLLLRVEETEGEKRNVVYVEADSNGWFDVDELKKRAGGDAAMRASPGVSAQRSVDSEKFQSPAMSASEFLENGAYVMFSLATAFALLNVISDSSDEADDIERRNRIWTSRLTLLSLIAGWGLLFISMSQEKDDSGQSSLDKDQPNEMMIDSPSSPAMAVTPVKQAPGGIDLNPAMATMDIQKDGAGVVLTDLPQEMIDAAQNATGFVPVISNINMSIGVQNLFMLLGLREEDETTAVAAI